MINYAAALFVISIGHLQNSFSSRGVSSKSPAKELAWAILSGKPHRSSIYDILGQRVRTLVTGQQGAGFYRLAWKGRDQADRMVASGVYFYRLATAGFSQTRKMTLIK